MLSKQILFFQCAQPPDDELARRLAQAGWTVRVAHDVDEAAAVQAANDCPVGLAIMDATGRVSASDLRRIVGRRPMEWVALVPRELIERPRDAQLLAAAVHDFHTLPVDFDRLLVVLGHALGKSSLLRSTLPAETALTGRFGMVGRSAKMLELYRTLDKIVPVDAPVLISGESGTGKELVARAIHQHSRRARGPFVTVNCGALPVTLVQAELFGHEKGSFTGAHQRRVGSIECAEGGTIFLDEIADLPLESQGSLLRFLQEKTIVRVGSTRTIRVDARVVAATHLDLAGAVRQNRFREDLFYRLNVLHLHAPPLRERPGDVSLLAQWMLEANPAGRGTDLAGFSPRALAAMESYHWPGNVRELFNRLQKALIMCEGPYIEPEDLGLTRGQAGGLSGSLAAARTTTQRDLIRHTLEQYEFNVAASARSLGVSRVTLYRLMRKLEIAHRSAYGAAHRVEGTGPGNGG
jgi:DNA-binding NtrC family response regulator